MATTLTITPQNTKVTATSSETTLSLTPQSTVVTVSSAIPTGVATTAASSVSYSGVSGTTLENQSTVQAALTFLAKQFFVATSAPAADTSDLAEGDLFYDTDDNQLKLYREVSEGSFAFVPIMVGGEGGDSDTIDAGSF